MNKKKADENANNLLQELEEESKKPSRRKRRTSKKSTTSLNQASTSNSSHPSSIVEKQPLPEAAARPKEPAALDLLQELYQGAHKNLSLHSRITRWDRVTAETLKDIQEW